MKKPVLLIGIGGVVLLGAWGGKAFLFKDPHIAKGRAVYAHYCAHCHGTKGNGNGYNAVNLDPRPRDHTDGREKYMAGKTNEELYEAVTKGGMGIGKSPFMPLFGGTLSDEERWSLVAYMRTLHSNQAPKVDFASLKPDPERPNRNRFRKAHYLAALAEFEQSAKEEGTPIEEAREKMARIGKRLFEDKFGCISCHRVGGEVEGAVGPALTRVGFRIRPDYAFQWLKNPQGIKPDTKMPNFMLRDRDTLAIVMYLSTLKAPAEGPPETRGGRP